MIVKTVAEVRRQDSLGSNGISVCSIFRPSSKRKSDVLVQCCAATAQEFCMVKTRIFLLSLQIYLSGNVSHATGFDLDSAATFMVCIERHCDHGLDPAPCLMVVHCFDLGLRGL